MQNNIKELHGKIVEWNKLTGQVISGKFTIPSPDVRRLSHDLMVEESEELFDATDKDQVLDAFADQLVILFGNMGKYGVTYDEVIFKLRQVSKSNYSKFAKTKQQAEDSIKSESERLNIPESDISYVRYDGYYVIYNNKTGKTLKCVDYKEPNEF